MTVGGYRFGLTLGVDQLELTLNRRAYAAAPIKKGQHSYLTKREVPLEGLGTCFCFPAAPYLANAPESNSQYDHPWSQKGNAGNRYRNAL